MFIFYLLTICVSSTSSAIREQNFAPLITDQVTKKFAIETEVAFLTSSK
jgi:hypothetical protein